MRDAIKKANDRKVVRRLCFVSNLYAGDTIGEAARRVGASQSIGSQWLECWNQDGPRGVIPRFGGVATRTANMPTYIARIDVNEDEFQNPQELVSVWGTIREDIERLDGEILQKYAVLGGYDFHLAFEVESGEVAFQVSQVIERHGFDTKTDRTLPLDRIGSANSSTISDRAMLSHYLGVRSEKRSV